MHAAAAGSSICIDRDRSRYGCSCDTLQPVSGYWRRTGRPDRIHQQTAIRLKKKAAEEFREQLVWGLPTNQDEAGLRQLSTQIKSGKVTVKLFLRHTLHAKLYLLYRTDPNNPTNGFLKNFLKRTGSLQPHF